MKRPPSRLTQQKAAQAAHMRKVYLRRRIAALAVLALGIGSVFSAVTAASWANETATTETTTETTAETTGVEQVSTLSEPTPSLLPQQTTGETQTTQTTQKVTQKVKQKVKQKTVANAGYVIAGHKVPAGLHPTKKVLKAASKVKHTDRFPRGANVNANDRRREWLDSDRTVKPGTVRAVAVGLVVKEGWSLQQWACLDRLWWHESGWNYHAGNKYGAYGIPQSLPGRKMSEAGRDWRTNPTTQMRWGVDYIKGRYGTPCKALKSWGKRAARSQGWY